MRFVLLRYDDEPQFMRAEKSLVNDATSSILGVFYQLCVALDCAFLLEEGQKLWIERFGDVTTSSGGQFEVKNHAGSLTDNHPNFWKTLKNWLDPSFDHAQYSYLTLFTTQAFGQNSKLASWNDLAPQSRLDLVDRIVKDSELRYIESQNAGAKEPPEVLCYQRIIWSAANRERLTFIVPKIRISCDAPNMGQLRKKIFDQHGKAVLRSKMNEFVDDLLAFLISPTVIRNGWEISFEDFCAKVVEVSGRYRRDTRIFPHIKEEPTNEQLRLQEEKLFVKKLHEIEYASVVREAIRHYIYASATILQEFRNYEVNPALYDVYRRNLRQHHGARHRAEMRNAKGDLILASKNFYDSIVGENPQPFGHFDQTPVDFRNGVFHMLADEESGDFHWRLWL